MITNRWLTNWKNALRRSSMKNRGRRQTGQRYAAAAEVMESRQLLTALNCFGQIEGTVYNDLTDDGLTGDDVRIVGASVHLYQDGGDGIFSSSDGVQAGDDVFLLTDVSAAVTGEYQFVDLAAGSYFVEQDSGLAGYIHRSGADVAFVTISAADALGSSGITIDDFSDPVAPQVVTANSGSLTASSSAAVGAIGSERDLFASRTSGSLGVDFAANAIANTLTISSGTGTTGYGVVTWDGTDGSSVLAPAGLGGIDLTDGGSSTGVRLNRSGDFVGSITITIHTDASNSSSITTTVPTSAAEVFLKYSDFTIASGTGANFASVGAVQMRIEGPAGFDGEVDLFETYGPTVSTVDFVNFEPLTLGGTVFRDANNSGTFQSGTETTISSVAMTLFEDTNANGVLDVGTDAQLGTTSTVAGNYSFTNLFPGEYLVRIDASNFAPASALSGLRSSTGNGVAPDPDNDSNNDDNGDHIGGVATAAIVAQAITLTNQGEPINDGDLDNNTNFSLDFGVFGTVDIEVTKSDNVDPVTAGSGAGNLVYTITAKNNGPADATGVAVTDALIASLPTGWALSSAVGSGSTTFTSGTGVWTIGNLASGVTETLTVTITVGSSSASGTTTNTVTVTAVDQLDTDNTNDSASEDTSVQRRVDIAVAKSDNVDPVTAGSAAGNLVYTVTATNNGPSNATSVAVTDELFASLPTGWTLVSGSGTGTTSFASGSGIWTIGNLARGATETLTLTFTVGSSAASGTTTNTVRVTGVTETDTNSANNVANEDTTVQRQVDIAVAKSDNVDPVTAGSGSGNLVYTVTATNNGPSDATSVAVTDELFASLPSGWVLVSGVGTGTTSFASGSGIWTIGNLARGATEMLTLTFTVGSSAASGTTTNTVRVTGVTEPDTNSANNAANENTTVQRQVDIAVAKSDNVDPVTAGSAVGNLVYTVTATNNGPSNASGVAVTDELFAALPTGWLLVSGVGSGTTSFAGLSGIWTIGSLASGTSETLTLTFTVGASAITGTTTNTVRVTSVVQTDTNSANDVAHEDTTVLRQVDVAVAKSDNVDPVTAGSSPGNLVYTVTATNNGPSNATGVAVTDALFAALPTGWILASGTGTGITSFSAGTGIWAIGNLASGVTETLTLTFTVGSSAASGTTTNTVTVTSVNEFDTNAANDVANEDTTVQRRVDIAVVKSDNVDPVIAGSGVGNLIYTVVATNNGPSNATGVIITDALIASLPTGWTLVSANGTGTTSFNSSTGVWAIGNLATSASETLSVTVTVGTAAANGVTTNTATVTSLNETDTDPTNNTDSEDTTVGRQVDIAVTKSDSVDPVTAGSGTGNLTYTITATNNGPSSATGVQVSDALIASLPAGWSLNSATGSGTTSFSAGTGIWTIGNLSNGATETLTVVVTVGTSAASGTVTNTATVSAVNETDINPSNDTAIEDTTVRRLVDIAVTKSDNVDPVTAGSGSDNLVYTVTATNNGPSNATSVQLTDAFIATLPTGFSLVSASGSGTTSFNSSTGVWTIGNLSTGGTETLTLTLTVGAAAAFGTVTNTVVVSNVAETDTNSANDVATEDTTVNRVVDIGVTKSDSVDPVTAGSGTGNLTYTIVATNFGPSNASGVAITDALIAALPTGFSLVSASGTGGSTFSSSTGVWTIGSLNVGSSQTLTVNLTVGGSAESGTILNTAVVSAVDQTDSDLTNDIATEDTTVARQIDIALLKTDANDPVIAGSGPGNLIYTITATNNGPSQATGLQVTDALIAALPAGFSYVSAVGTGGSTFSNTTGVWNIGTLNSGASQTLTVTLTVGMTANVASITNVAAVSNVNETDTDPTNDTATEGTTISRLVDIAILKTDSTDPVVAGSGVGNLVYTVTATNNGPADATGVQVGDAMLANLPDGMSFVSVSGTGNSTFDSSTGVWTIGDLASGASRQLVVTLTVGGTVAAGTLTNVATVVNVNETDTNPTNDIATEATRVAREVDLVITKVDLVDPVRSPGQISYTLTVRNNGPSVATNVVLTDTLSSQVDFSSAVSSQGTVVENGGVVTGMLGSINPGDVATVTLVVNVDLPLGGTVNNIATVVATEPETDTTNNGDDEVTSVQPALSSISGVVYQDLNNNGLQDAGEAPISGAQVGLFGTAGDGSTVVRTVTTDAAGAYRFDDLLQGTYNLFEVQPRVYVDGVETAGTGGGTSVVASNDSFFAINLQTANAVGFNFGEGKIDESKRNFLASSQNSTPPAPVDAAATGRLSGRVILDNNRNGVVDAGDVGLFGVAVTLVGNRSTGEPVVVNAITNSNGEYVFSGLPAGNYSIVEAQPPGYSDGPEKVGTLMADSVIDDVFASIALADGGVGTDFNFLERTPTAVVTGAVAPVLAAQSVQTETNPTLTWMPVADAVRYEVWLSNLTGTAGTVYKDSNVTGTSVRVPVALALGTHRLWVRAIDAQGLTGPWSSPVTFDVSPQPIITTPVARTVDLTPELRWEAVPGAELYDLIVQKADGSEVVKVLGTTAHSYQVTNSLAQGDYRMWIRSSNADVVGEWSDGVEFTIAGEPKVLGPQTASVLASPLLEWTDTGADEYRVWVSDITAGSTKLLDTTVTGTSLLLTNAVQDGHRYRYWVQGLAAGIATKWSSPATFTVSSTTQILGPVGTTSGNKPTIEWVAYSGATHYDVWVSDSTGLYLRDQSVKGTSFTFTTAIPDGDYRVWVQPVGVASSASWSKVSKFSVGGLATPVLTSPSVTTNDRTPTFTWSQDSTATMTEIWINHNGVTNRLVHETNLAGSSYTPNVTFAAGNYTIWIRSRNTSGLLSAWSSALRLNIT